MKKIAVVVFLSLGCWALIAPQANLGLTELRWLARFAFPGEALVGVVLLGLAYYLLGSLPQADKTSPSSFRAKR